MKIEDMRSTYTHLTSLEEPYRMCVIHIGDDFFREDILLKYLCVCSKKVCNENIKHIQAADFYKRRFSLSSEKTFFDTDRLWVVEGVSSLPNTQVEALIACTRDDFFVFVDAESPPLSLVSAAELHIALPNMKPWDRPPLIASWIVSYCRKYSFCVSGDVAQLLAERCSYSRSYLVNELEKVLTFCQHKREITMEDIVALSDLPEERTARQMLDALLANDSRAFFVSLQGLYEMPEIALIRFLKGQLQKLLVPSLQTSFSKTQKRRMEIAKKRGHSRVLSWINRLEMREIALRSGSNYESLMVFCYALISAS